MAELERCLFDGCTRRAARHVFPFDGIHPNTLYVCAEHQGLLEWLGVTMPAPMPHLPSEPRHWLDDEAPEDERVAPAWRLVEYGLPGMAHPAKARRILEEMRQGLRAEPQLGLEELPSTEGMRP